MRDLSILIPARNEAFLFNTIEDILRNKRADTEIIAVLDGYWPDPGLPDHPDVILVHTTDRRQNVGFGQRQATNLAARISEAKYIMKCDAHVAFDEGFDEKLLADMQPDWTMVPRMYNLHVFNWRCEACGRETYQGPLPTECDNCGTAGPFKQVEVWQPRLSTKQDFMWFNKDLRYSYFDNNHLEPEEGVDVVRKYHHQYRPWAQDAISDQMVALGACWLMERERYWELGGLDADGHGSWGQMGVEIALKSWLSGGRQVVNKKTWFAHLFRTNQKGFSFPYHISGNQVEHARKYSRDLWLNDKWPGARRTLEWLIGHFAPVQGWAVEPERVDPSVGILYYSDNQLDPELMAVCQRQLQAAAGALPIVSVTLEPTDLGDNYVLPLERGILTMFKQILRGLEALDTDVVFFCEHDVLYHPSHFEWIPPKRHKYYYNENVWKVDVTDGKALFHYVQQTSGLVAFRELLLGHYQERVRRVEAEGFTRRMGFEPGTHGRAERVDDYSASSFMSDVPNIDLRHGRNLTPSRWRKDQFRNQRYTRGWKEADEVPGWGKTKGRMSEFLAGVPYGCD